MSWIPLHCHSQYSILDATATVQALAKQAAFHKMAACALTDHGNLFGAVDFYKSCKEVGIKPLIGCEVYVAPGARQDKKKEAGFPASFHLTLLAKNSTGYRNLCKLSSMAYLEGFYYKPRIDKEILKQYSEGLICLSGCQSGEAAFYALKGIKDPLVETLNWYREVFKEDYYIELMRHPMSEHDLRQDGLYEESWLLQYYNDYLSKQEKINYTLSLFAQELAIPLVATNDSHYIERADWRAHEVLLNVQSGEPCELVDKDSFGNPKNRRPNPKRLTYATHELYFKSPQQMEKLFQDLPEALHSTLAIAEKCHLQIDFKSKHYPVYLPPDLKDSTYTKEEQAKSVENYLWKLCREGIAKRYTQERLDKIQELYPNQEPLTVIEERLKYEMSVIVPKEMGDYLLIVWDFINWAKNKAIPMGPGRGSGAGSIVLYLIGITDIEPLRFHLFFERFINPERLSYPDIDVDICMERRGDVIRYTLDKYGRENIAQIITFGTMKARMAIKDVGRALSIPLTKVNAIVKLVPEDLNITLDKALDKDQELRALYEQDEDARRILDLGRKLEGSIRNTGIHAAGIIISGRPLMELIPICNAKDSDMPVTQYSMKPAELVGMLKVDFLGLKTLTAIQKCVEAIQYSSGQLIDWVNLPLDDTVTFSLLNQGKTLGIFQLESSGMQDLARNLHLDKFEEIIAVGALYRPGPMDMIPSFINRKHGREPIEYDHPWMKEILAETYGIMVYQEQVMQIANQLGKFSLGEGDVLRRAMGKKDAEQMATQREKFRLGALLNGIQETISMQIFDKMEKFAAYGFNKSHAAAYGYLSYVTAFFKANYPREWMSALMTCDQDDLSKVAKFIRESHAMGIKILPPDINEAREVFVAAPAGIRFAMTGIKGVGTGVVETILRERSKNGPFANLYDFFKRVDVKKVGKKVIENLVDAGCFDFTHWSRDALRQAVEPMFEAVTKEQAEQAKGILSLFAKIENKEESRFKMPLEVKNTRSKLEMLLKEKELLGFFLTGHPMDAYQNLLKRLSCLSLNSIDQLEHDAVFRLAFIVESSVVRLSNKTQKKFAILMINDGIESYELPIWSDIYEEKHSLLKENQLLYAVLQLDKREETPRLTCRWLNDLTRADEKMVEECDQALDKAKMMAMRAKKSVKNKENLPNKKELAKPQKMEQARFSLKFNLDKGRLSHILQIKELFENHRGTMPVKITFISSLEDQNPLASLLIDSQMGINLTQQFQEELSQIPCVCDITHS